MAIKGRNQRQIRKQVLRHLQDTFDLQRLEYRKRVTPLRHGAKLVGVMAAGIVYSLGFGLAYYAWKTGKAEYETFGKFVWIFMVPASVVGAFTYMLSSNRREFSIAKDIFEHMDDVEGPRGMLWRYEPILQELYGEDEMVKRVIAASRDGSIMSLEPEDYAKVVHQLYDALSSGEGRSISDEAAAEFEANFADQQA